MGPSAGVRRPLASSLTVGREAELRIGDQGLSRENLRLTVTGGTVLAEDLGSLNGTYLFGRRLDSATPVPVDAPVEAASSVLRVHPVRPVPAPELPVRGGVARFHRPQRAPVAPAAPRHRVRTTQRGDPAPVPAPDPAPATNRAPSISAANQSSGERQSVSATFSASHPDGDAVSISVSGLPAGLSASNGRVTGTVSHTAASATTDRRQGIRSQSFTVTITANDGRGGTDSATVTWTVADTHTVMPDYYEKYGCGNSCGEGSFPDVAALSSPGFFCTVDPTREDRIVAQSVPSGTVVAWGQSINYTYARSSC